MLAIRSSWVWSGRVRSGPVGGTTPSYKRLIGPVGAQPLEVRSDGSGRTESRWKIRHPIRSIRPGVRLESLTYGEDPQSRSHRRLRTA